MNFELYLYGGLRTAVPIDPNYELQKDYAVNRTINFELSNLIKDYFSHTPSIYNSVGIVESPEGEIAWVNYIGTWTYSNAGGSPTTASHTSGNTYAFLSTEGWSPIPDYNNPNYTGYPYFVSRPRYVMPDAYEVLPISNFGTSAVNRLEIVWSDGEQGNFEWSGGFQPPNYSLYAERAVCYWGVGPQNLNDLLELDSLLKPENHECGESYVLNFYNDLDELVHSETYTLTCECKYTPYQIAFVNRYGMMDYMTWFKRSDEEIAFTTDTYKASIYQDGFTSASVESRVYTDFNINGRKSVTLNSDWVDEVYKYVLEDILMSKEVWILEGADWLAVNPERSTLNMKKEVNEKMINYTMKFTYAVDDRPLIR